MTGLRLSAVELRVGSRRLLQGFDLDVPPGAVVTLTGPSGCGKSSLLAFVAGLLPAGIEAKGEVHLDGERIDGLPAERRRLGLLFQDDLLFPHLTVCENLAFAVPAVVRGRRARRDLAEEALAQAGLAGRGGEAPDTLSGGERARAALMRTLLARPRALLLDEPFGRLDAALRTAFRGHVFAEASARGLPVLLVTHDPADAAAAGGPVVPFSGVPGVQQSYGRAPERPMPH